MSSTNLLCGSDVGEGESSAFYMGSANTEGEGDQNIDSFCVSLILDEGRGCAQHRTLMTVCVGQISVYHFDSHCLIKSHCCSVGMKVQFPTDIRVGEK